MRDHKTQEQQMGIPFTGRTRRWPCSRALMCLDCGCRRPWDDDGYMRHIILPELQDAAQTLGIPALLALSKIYDTSVLVPHR